jgi:hypothetical protein
VNMNILKQFKAVRATLKRERVKLQRRLAAIQAVLGGEIPTALPAAKAKAPVKPKRGMSAAGRAKVRAAAKAYWAAYRAKKAGKAAPKPARKVRKRVSPAARAKMAAAAKARWAKAKASGKKRL